MPDPDTWAATAREALRPGVRAARRQWAAALDRVESASDPVVRPAVAALHRRRTDLTPEVLLARARHAQHLTPARWGRLRWVERRKRAIIPIHERQTPRTAARLLRSGRYEVTHDKAFADVVHHCATVRGRATNGRPWLLPEVQELYGRLHEMGHAHSVEVWRDGRLVGGEFGVAIGGLYQGDSVFFLESNASKIALAWLTEHLHGRGFVLLDTQVVSPLTAQFGAHYLSRTEYRRQLREALAVNATFAD
jgi:leucyl/phenylalanyl-tRNA--protein transferase